MSFPKCLSANACENEGYTRLMEGRHADLLFTDPPYCLLTRRKKGGDIRDPKGRKIDRDPVVRFDSVRDYVKFTESWLPKAAAHLQDSARMIIWTNFLGKEPIQRVAEKLGYGHVWGEFVWAKRTTARDGNELLLRVYEVALVFGRSAAPENSPDELPTSWSAVAGYDDDGEAAEWGEHPHHKPFSVLDPLIRTHSKVGDLILDPFAGSGSIPAAALRLNRRAACMELRPEWAQKVSHRMEKINCKT